MQPKYVLSKVGFYDALLNHFNESSNCLIVQRTQYLNNNNSNNHVVQHTLANGFDLIEGKGIFSFGSVLLSIWFFYCDT